MNPSEARPFTTLTLATGNPHKVAEIQALSDQSGLRLRIERPAKMPSVVENAGSFAGNARLKAAALVREFGDRRWVLADDSGLCVAALGGEPGVDSAYYAGAKADGAANLRKLLAVMDGIDDRRAEFVCVLVLRGPEIGEVIFEGRCAGNLTRSPVGEGGFGYDPVFVPEGESRTFSQISELEKNQVSHRARAWQWLVRWWIARQSAD